jgi:IPT/TIG domain
LHVVKLRRPVIESVAPQVVLKGGALTVTGQSLQGATTKVAFGSTQVDPATVSDAQVTVNAPPSLLAGVNTVKVVHPLDLGTAVEPHGGFESNVAAFILAPEITAPSPISVAAGATLTLAVDPPVGRSQRAALIVGDQTITIPPRPASPATTTSLDFPIPTDFPTGTFLLRVQVDGAESPLDTDPATGAYVGPTVTIT